MSKYTVYATSALGDGLVQEFGSFDSLNDIVIRTGFFAKDVTFYIEEIPCFNHTDTPSVDCVHNGALLIEGDKSMCLGRDTYDLIPNY